MVPLFGSTPIDGMGMNGAVAGLNQLDNPEWGGGGAGKGPGSAGGGAAACAAASLEPAAAGRPTRLANPHQNSAATICLWIPALCITAVARSTLPLPLAARRFALRRLPFEIEPAAARCHAACHLRNADSGCRSGSTSAAARATSSE